MRLRLKMIIYKILNKINGKCYVGRTTEKLDRRIYRHILGASKQSKYPLQRAIRKYGIHSFEVSIIDIADSKEVLGEKEIYWISYLNTKVPNGYNLTNGGDGSYGCSPSHETRKKMSESGKGKHSKTLSEETKKKISIGLTGKPPTRGRTGMPHTEETRRKMSIAAKARYIKLQPGLLIPDPEKEEIQCQTEMN